MSQGPVPFLYCDLYKRSHSEKTYSELSSQVWLLDNAVNHIKVILTVCHTGEYICLLKSSMSIISLVCHIVSTQTIMRKSVLFIFLPLFVTRPTILSAVSSVGLFGFILQFKKNSINYFYDCCPKTYDNKIVKKRNWYLQKHFTVRGQ